MIGRFDKRTSAISSLFSRCGPNHPSRFVSQIVSSVFLWLLVNSSLCWSQTASTGALIGEVLDPSGKGIPQATVNVKNQDLSFNRSLSSDDEGHFVLPLLAPGAYQLMATKSDFSQVQPTASSAARTRKVSTTPKATPARTDRIGRAATASPMNASTNSTRGFLPPG